MTQNVLDGVIEIEARASALVAEAKTKAAGVHRQVEAELAALGERLDAASWRRWASASMPKPRARSPATPRR